MKIATILPTKYLALEAGQDYHMCLAHLMDNDEYRSFFEWQAARGAHVIMDNGVVETGKPLHISRLLKIAADAGVTEMTLPDKIRDRMVTLHLHEHALELIVFCKDNSNVVGYGKQKVMVIPQGCDRETWIESVLDMLRLAWKYPDNVTAVGISKFCTGEGLFKSRLEALQSAPELLESDLAIHLLGCPDRPGEIRQVETVLDGRVRGVDSGLPVFYTLHGMDLGKLQERPTGIELDFDRVSTEGEFRLLQRNIHFWKGMINRFVDVSTVIT